MIFGAGCEVSKESESEEMKEVSEVEKVDNGKEMKSKTGKVIEKVPEKEQIEAGQQLDDNDKLIIGDIIQGAYIAEVQNQELLETDAGKNYFLLCYRYGGHLEELLAPYNVDGSSLQMTEEEINHLLEMAIGDKLDGKVEDIADGGYISQVGNSFFLVPADIGDYDYLTKVDTVEQKGKEVIVTGNVYVYECNVITAYDSYSCTFEMNADSIFAGLTLKELNIITPEGRKDKYEKFLTTRVCELISECTSATREEIVKESKFTLLDVNHDGIEEILVSPTGPSHADAYLWMYAYVNGRFQELPVGADEFGMFGSGNIYVTAGMHQGYEISYFSFDGVNYSKLLGKFFVPGDERETDHYEINGNDVTKEEAIAYEKKLLESIQDRRCYYGGEVLEEALYSDENVSVEFVDREKEWCNLEYQNVKEYLEAHMAE